MSKWLSMGTTPPGVLQKLQDQSAPIVEDRPRKTYKQRGSKNILYDYQAIAKELADDYPKGFTVPQLRESKPDIPWSALMKRMRALCPEAVSVLGNATRDEKGGCCYLYFIVKEQIPALVLAQEARRLAAEAARHRNFRRPL